MLVGRDEEQQRVAGLLEDARRGRSGGLLLVGDPGMGKTALIEEARRAAADMRQLLATGVESERELPFAGLHALLRPVLDLLPALPPSQATALEAALALRDGEPDALAVNAGLLSLLTAAAEAQPLLVVVDDLQWFDHASVHALAFTSRRLIGEQIAFLGAARPGTEHPLRDLPELRLEPLGRAESLELVRRRSTPLPPQDERTVVDAALGNPLVLLELPVRLAEELPSSASAGDRLAATFSSQVRALDSDGARGILVAAAEPDADVVQQAAVRLGVADPLGPAVALDLVTVTDGVVTFRHPVVRSLVYASAPPAERREVHAALAAVLAAPADRDRHAWHQAAATEGQDEEVARLLEETAGRAAARGGQVAAARALERAADLSPHPDDAARRLHDAARSTFWAGDADAALLLAERGLAVVQDPNVRADLISVLGGISAWHGERAPEALFLRALDGGDLDETRTSKLLYELVDQRLGRMDFAGAQELAPRLERAARHAGPWWEPRHLAGAACAYLAGGEQDMSERLSRELLADPAIPAGFAFHYMSLEWYDVLRVALDETLAAGRADGNLLRVVWNQMCAAHLEVTLGRLGAAERAAAEAIDLGETIGTPALAGNAAAALALVQAWRGQTDAASTNAEQGLRAAQTAGDAFQEITARRAIAFTALGAGHHDDVVTELAPCTAMLLAHPVHEPSHLAFVPDLVESLVQLGRDEEARRWHEPLARAGAESGRAWAEAASARCAALLAGPDPQGFTPLFERALDAYEKAGHRLELARTRLLLGERLRRAGQRREARGHLREAYRAFTDVGAEPWIERTAAELRATGDRLEERGRPLPALTPQEQNIARLVAEGRTNKEIAASLYLSPKTVEYHLASTFRKLDIHSRAELARIVSSTTD